MYHDGALCTLGQHDCEVVALPVPGHLKTDTSYQNDSKLLFRRKINKMKFHISLVNLSNIFNAALNICY